MERAVERDDAIALRMALGGVVCLRVTLIAHSIASAPELAKNTKSAKLTSHNRAASRSPSGLLNRFDMCQSFVRLLLQRRDQMRMRNGPAR